MATASGKGGTQPVEQQSLQRLQVAGVAGGEGLAPLPLG